MLAASHVPLDPPRVLGKMQLVAELGEGGMATVYLATVGQGPFARLAAVKLLRAAAADRDYRLRFLDEARVVVRLHHNNLVDVREAGETGGQLFILMELVEGRDLADTWDRCAELGRPFPIAIGVYVVREILRGLHYAHTFPGLSLVHRDVSPSNILIDWQGAVKLADFGLATSSLKAAMTVPGVVFGKVAYMSPEQALHQALDGRSDVYGCGVVLWELLTGRPMREGFDTNSVARFNATSAAAVNARVDPELDAIVMRALARDREGRWGSAETFLEALSGWLACHAPATTQESVRDFMNGLFGNVREREQAAHHQILARSVAATSTRIYDAEARFEPHPRNRVEDVVPEGIDSGTVIAERYRIVSHLGRGGMGIVYLAEHLTVGRSVAVKVLTHDWSRNPSVARRFRAEARAASAAGHPNIVEVFDAGELPDGRLYLVMEFLTGRSLLEAVTSGGPMAVARACRVVRDVARAVRAAHRVGIIHRDLKPDNVMLVERGEEEMVKVLDFGISAGVEEAAAGPRLTMAGQALGTPEYMAPEQARGVAATESFDIYALGVMLYETLTGNPPFVAETLVELLARKATEAAPSLGGARAGLPEALVRLVDDCLAIDPALRPPDADAFLGRLDAILHSLPRDGGSPPAVEATPRDAEVSAAPASSTRRVWMVVAIAGTAALFGVFWRGVSEGDSKAVPEVADGRRDPTLPPMASVAASDASGPRLPPSPSPSPSPSPAREPVPMAEARMPSVEIGEPPIREGPAAPISKAAKSGSPSGAWRTEACEKARRSVDEARRAHDWSTMLLHLRRPQCWENRTEHRRLEVLALKEEKDFSGCVRAGKGAADRETLRLIDLCRSRLEAAQRKH